MNDPHSGTAHFDPESGTMILAENRRHAAGYAEIFRFDPVTADKTLLQMWGPTMRQSTGALDTADSQIVWCGDGVPVQRIRVGNGGQLGTEVSGDTRLHDVLGPGLVYDSRRDRFTGWGAGDTRALFHLSKGDWAWTTETPEAGATPPPINDHGVYGRFQYAPEYDVFILAVTVDGPVLMYEPVDWSP